MKRIEFRKFNDHQRGIKSLSIRQKTSDKDSVTCVHKSFLYNVAICEDAKKNIQPPQIFIRKCFHSETKTETFSFKVKGAFYLKHQRLFLKVKFFHHLHIEIRRKTKVFSPKKSAVLTK